MLRNFLLWRYIKLNAKAQLPWTTEFQDLVSRLSDGFLLGVIPIESFCVVYPCDIIILKPEYLVNNVNYFKGARQNGDAWTVKDKQNVNHASARLPSITLYERELSSWRVKSSGIRPSKIVCR